MTSAPTATRLLSPLVAVMASLVCVLAACSLRSLDYLQNGDRRDGAIGNQDVDMSTPDTVSPSGALLDATAEDGAVLDAPVLDALPTLDSSKLDSPFRDSLVLDTRGEIGNNQGTDTSTPDTVGPDGARLDATPKDGTVGDARVLDVPPTLDSFNPERPDSPSGADRAFGGSGGTADGGTPQGGAGGHSSSSGGSSNAGGTSSTGGTAGTSSIDGGDGGEVATGGQADATGGTDGSTEITACSGVLRAGICWYLGPQGSSCQQACATHGQPATGAASHVGTATQGGSLAECRVILGLLGITGTPSTSFGLEGLGCFMRANGSLYWLSVPNFSATASAGNASLVCGCTK